MVDDLGTVRIGIKRALPAAVPYQTTDLISHIAFVAVE